MLSDLAPTITTTSEEFVVWLNGAERGAWALYHTGPHVLETDDQGAIRYTTVSRKGVQQPILLEVAQQAAAAAERGLVVIAQRRIEGGFAYLARRCHAQRPGPQRRADCTYADDRDPCDPARQWPPAVDAP
jgi:hypothetical protein